MSKLNFGCGNRIADGWINIDFHSNHSNVRRLNLLKGFPYPDNHFEVVYSSHVLEHFTREQALFLLSEANRVLRPAGTLRLVVPDLADTCKEYFRILSLPDDDKQKGLLYEWIIIELIDQLVRSCPSGEMGLFFQKLRDDENEAMLNYVRSRTQNTPCAASAHQTCFIDKLLRRLSPQNLSAKITYLYLRCVGRLIPKHLRSMVLVETSIGERHRWVYDFYGLSKLCEKAGFVNCRSLAYNESAVCGFNEYFLDSNPDGSSYKNNSIYLEASK